MRIAFIGGGTMAEAILNGVLEKKLAAPADIAVVEPVEALVLGYRMAPSCLISRYQWDFVS